MGEKNRYMMLILASIRNSTPCGIAGRVKSAVSTKSIMRAHLSSTTVDDMLEHRDVFVFDYRWPLKKWATTLSTPPAFNQK